jgi:hypothetical protein
MTQTCGVAPVRVVPRVVAALMLGLGGCGGSEETTRKKPTPAATKAPAAAVPEELVGTWTRRFTRRELRAFAGPPGNTPGEVTMKVRPDGTSEMYLVGSDTAEDCEGQGTCESSEFKESAGQLTIGATVDCAQPAEYSFNIAADKVTFDPVKEDCPGDRSAWFGGTTWQRTS